MLSECAELPGHTADGADTPVGSQTNLHFQRPTVEQDLLRQVKSVTNFEDEFPWMGTFKGRTELDVHEA